MQWWGRSIRVSSALLLLCHQAGGKMDAVVQASHRSATLSRGAMGLSVSLFKSREAILRSPATCRHPVPLSLVRSMRPVWPLTNHCPEVYRGMGSASRMLMAWWRKPHLDCVKREDGEGQHCVNQGSWPAAETQIIRQAEGTAGGEASGWTWGRPWGRLLLQGGGVWREQWCALICVYEGCPGCCVEDLG